MDDLLTGAETIEEIKELKEELTKLLEIGGFMLHKWKTNITRLNDIATDDKAIDINKEQQSKLLEIHDNSSPTEWRHVQSKDNPADLIFRGTTPKQLIRANLWWEGPSWLSLDKVSWPKENEDLSPENIPEMRKQTVIAVAVDSKKNERRIRIVSVLELEEAKLAIIKMVQEAEFKEDIKDLKENNVLTKNSKLIALQPFLDKHGVLRLGGRLKNAVLPDKVKHPIIIPSSHQLTRLIIIHFHEKLFHTGTQTTLNSIREEFWPLHAKTKIKGIIRS
ncbi:PREDICTED: uncharacterized protein LOC108764867 [Trachymyrmex cornetzi]|uniref:uncharacterized protein LOC108764867 n=1 Tax=Trachymyrmex cornetzi TaxID=471704 RepID=UPI00084F3FE2|nr:PREDICTED: uncharacterized protein LOC108764867 [Trachymyrmex cornetzi]